MLGRSDPDRPSTWVPFQKEYCAKCVAACCMMPVEVTFEDLVTAGLLENSALSPKQAAKALMKKKLVRNYRAATGLFMLEQKNGRDCVFLDKNRLCTIYEKRPKVCRDFPERMGLKLGFCPYKERKRDNQ